MLAFLCLIAMFTVIALGVVITQMILYFGKTGQISLPACLLNEVVSNPWNELNTLARGISTEESVIFDVSIVPVGVEVSNTSKFAGYKSVVRQRVKTAYLSQQNSNCMRCGKTIDLYGEIKLAIAWWEACLRKALGRVVKLRLLGYEVKHDKHPAVSTMDVYSDTFRKRHNIGNIRICAWSFRQDAKLPNDVLMMCYRHGPDAANGYQGLHVHNEPCNYLGNVHINTDVCWTSALNNKNARGCYVVSSVLAHEVGHAFGLGHDCSDRHNASESGTWGGFFDCVGELPTTIMEPGVEINNVLPSSCGEWIQEHVRELYTAKRSTYATKKTSTISEIPEDVYRPLIFHTNGCDCAKLNP